MKADLRISVKDYSRNKNLILDIGIDIRRFLLVFAASLPGCS